MFVYEAIQYQAAGQLGQVTAMSLHDASNVLTPDAAKTTVLLLSSRFASSPTASGRIINGQPALQPSLDPAADFYTYVASMQGGGMTALDQLKTRQSGWVILVDADKLAAIVNGSTDDLPYAIAKDDATAQTLIKAAAGGGQMLAIVPASSISPAAGAGGEKAQQFSLVTPLIGAGIGFLVGGPGGALVGAGVGAGVEYYRTHHTA